LQQRSSVHHSENLTLAKVVDAQRAQRASVQDSHARELLATNAGVVGSFHSKQATAGARRRAAQQRVPRSA
jgi:hypothetical protein